MRPWCAGWAVCGFAAVLVLAALPGSEAVYTKVKQGQQKCFIELLHANRVVVVKYESPDQAPLPHDSESQKGHVGVLFQVCSSRGRARSGSAGAGCHSRSRPLRQLTAPRCVARGKGSVRLKRGAGAPVRVCLCPGVGFGRCICATRAWPHRTRPHSEGQIKILGKSPAPGVARL